MEELGLFPLGIVLLPTETVPLHIFEPRYRELIGECIEEDREFGLVYADEGGVRELGTRGRVAAILERFDDGRLNIVVEGGRRFLVERLTRGRTYMTAEVADVDDDAVAADAAPPRRGAPPAARRRGPPAAPPARPAPAGAFRALAALAGAETEVDEESF